MKINLVRIGLLLFLCLILVINKLITRITEILLVNTLNSLIKNNAIPENLELVMTTISQIGYFMLIIFLFTVFLTIIAEAFVIISSEKRTKEFDFAKFIRKVPEFYLMSPISFLTLIYLIIRLSYSLIKPLYNHVINNIELKAGEITKENNNYKMIKKVKGCTTKHTVVYNTSKSAHEMLKVMIESKRTMLRMHGAKEPIINLEIIIMWWDMQVEKFYYQISLRLHSSISF